MEVSGRPSEAAHSQQGCSYTDQREAEGQQTRLPSSVNGALEMFTRHIPVWLTQTTRLQQALDHSLKPLTLLDLSLKLLTLASCLNQGLEKEQKSLSHRSSSGRPETHSETMPLCNRRQSGLQTAMLSTFPQLSQQVWQTLALC